MERRSNRVGGIPTNCQYLEYKVEVGTPAANSHHGQQYPLHKQPECKAANLSNPHDAKTCSPWADHVSSLGGRRGAAPETLKAYDGSVIVHDPGEAGTASRGYWDKKLSEGFGGVH